MRIVIFGSGYHGRLAMRKMEYYKSKKNNIFFIDNSKKKFNKKCLHKKIFPVNKLKNLDYDLIVMCGRNIQKQIIQLKKYNIPNNKYLFLGKSELRPKKQLFNIRSGLFYEMLKELVPKLEINKINYWMDYSGLLSLIRNENFGELSDIEIAIDHDDVDKTIDIFKNCKTFKTELIYVKKRKFILRQRKKFNRICLFSKYRKNNIELPHIDIIIKKLYKKYAFNMFLEKKFPIKYWEKNSFKSYKSLKLRIPHLTKEYLNILYGKNWKKKTEFWGIQGKNFKSVSKKFYYNLLNN